MNISVLLAHPDPRSFSHAIAHTVQDTMQKNGHHVFFHDLYREHFNPLLSAREIPKGVTLDEKIEIHCREITEAQGIIVIHPNWWGQPPAILKGWIDRIIRPGVAYEFLEGDNGEGIPNGLLRAQAALVFNTSNTNPEREQQVFGDPLETIWKNCVFGLCGVETFYRRVFSILVTSTLEQRITWLEEVQTCVNRYFPPAIP